MYISKHLMLLFIKVKHSREFIITTFQNISCYCLSTAEHLNTVKKWYFKTSHVIVYLSRAGSTLHRSYISKHLMLLFIEDSETETGVAEAFQNISCYCLSVVEDCMATVLCYFKTSHVIVYLPEEHRTFLFPSFQNISCYCLSRCLIYCNLSHSNFKTSHVIVYHAIPYLEQYVDSHFKTSHVIVYLRDVQKISFQEDFKTSHVIVYHQGR